MRSVGTGVSKAAGTEQDSDRKEPSREPRGGPGVPVGHSALLSDSVTPHGEAHAHDGAGDEDEENNEGADQQVQEGGEEGAAGGTDGWASPITTPVPAPPPAGPGHRGRVPPSWGSSWAEWGREGPLPSPCRPRDPGVGTSVATSSRRAEPDSARPRDHQTRAKGQDTIQGHLPTWRSMGLVWPALGACA